MRRDRRVHQRHPATWELKGRLLRPIDLDGNRRPGRRASIHGKIVDIGAGGLCLVSPDKADPAVAVRGEIFDPEIPVRIPTLLLVRWVFENPDGLTYRLGLQFLV